MASRLTATTINRRGLLSGTAALGGLALADALPALARYEERGHEKPARGSRSPSRQDRLEQAYEVRLRAARQARGRGMPLPQPNGDEERLPGGIGCYTKGLPHN